MSQYYTQQQQQQAQPWSQPQQSGGAFGQQVIGGVSQKVASKNPLTFFVSRENQKGMRRLVNLQNNVIWTTIATIALITALGLLVAYGLGGEDRNSAYLVAGLSTLLIICLPLYIIAGSGISRAKRCAGSVSAIALPPGKGKIMRGLRAGQRLAGPPPPPPPHGQPQLQPQYQRPMQQNASGSYLQGRPQSGFYQQQQQQQQQRPF